MPNLIKKFTRYFMTGGTAAIVDAGGFAILHFLGISFFLAAALSFCLAAIVNYLLTSQFVFDQVSSHKNFYKFFIVALIGLTINLSLTAVLIDSLNFYPVTAKITAIGLTFVINFFLNAKFVFQP